MFCKSLQKMCVITRLISVHSGKIVHSSWADHLQKPPAEYVADYTWKFWLLYGVSKEILAFGGLFFLEFML